MHSAAFQDSAQNKSLPQGKRTSDSSRVIQEDASIDQTHFSSVGHIDMPGLSQDRVSGIEHSDAAADLDSGGMHAIGRPDGILEDPVLTLTGEWIHNGVSISGFGGINKVRSSVYFLYASRVESWLGLGF
jgi:hypothetical protein